MSNTLANINHRVIMAEIAGSTQSSSLLVFFLEDQRMDFDVIVTFFS